MGCSEPVCNLLAHVCPMPLVLMVIGGVSGFGARVGGISTAVSKHMSLRRNLPVHVDATLRCHE
eukprot:7475128-Alexandrium_andersonii.AAC.1